MGIQKRPCKGKWGFYIGNLEGMRVNREIYLLFHFDEIENIRIEEKFKGDSLKIHLLLYIFRIYEYRRNFLIPVNLDRSRENSLRFIFLFFFFPLFFSILHRSGMLFREEKTGESSSISTNKWNWTVWRTLSVDGCSFLAKTLENGS